MQESKRMPTPEWIKELRARLGDITQNGLVEMLRLSDRSTVAKWENGTQNPGLQSWKKLLALAPPDLLRCAPGQVAGLGVAEWNVNVSGAMPKGYVSITKEGATVAEEIDAIEEPLLRRRARNAALRAIEETLRGPPPPPPPVEGTARQGKT